MFQIKWLNDNRVIGTAFAVLATLNAWAMAAGLYR